ncbi:hypothetical protein ACW73L_09150 [Methylolobus aquaticus]
MMRRTASLAIGMTLATLFADAGHTAPQDILHHHIHNWSRNYSPRQLSSPTWARAERHAVAMGYSTVNRGRAEDPAFDHLGVSKDFNGAFYPVIFDFSTNRLRYRPEAENGYGGNFIRPGATVGNFISMSRADMELLSVFGCSRRAGSVVLSPTATRAQFETAFYALESAPGGIWAFANLQNRWVVEQLAQGYTNAIINGDFSGTTFDDIARTPPDNSCANRDVRQDGRYYNTWKEGQKALLQRITAALHSATSPLGYPYFVAANMYQINNSNSGNTYGAWYADRSLRLDAYYLERGTQGGHDQRANSTDPETGRPAFSYQANGAPRNFIPADRIHVSTAHQEFPPFSDFLREHLEVAGIAGRQGSWFSYIVGMGVDKTYSNGTFVFNNTLQLLRAIPNFDNLAEVPLTARFFNAASLTYTSPNSYASPSVVYSRNPINGEMYAVFLRTTGAITLRSNEYVASAVYTNPVFDNTTSNAIGCLRRGSGTVSLICSSRVGQGIRLKLARR